MGMAGNPGFFVLDEPTTGLDMSTQAHILDLLREIQVSSRTAMLYIGHDMGAIARVCDRLAVMYAGEIVEDEAIDDVYADPVHTNTRGLLGSVPRLSYAGRPPAPGDDKVGCAPAPRCGFTSRWTQKDVWTGLVRCWKRCGPLHDIWTGIPAKCLGAKNSGSPSRPTLPSSAPSLIEWLCSIKSDLRGGASGGRAGATARQGHSGGRTAGARQLFPATLSPPHRVHLRRRDAPSLFAAEGHVFLCHIPPEADR